MTPSPDPVLSVVVVSYNTREMTLACLASVFRETAAPVEVIVVDNASTDGSAEAVAQAFPQVRLLAERVNHGFARAHPIAVDAARAPWLLLLNPDTVVLDGALDRLLDFAARTPEAGIWGGRTVFADGRLNPASCWRRMTLWSVLSRTLGLTAAFPRSTLFNPEPYPGWDRSSEREVDIVSGCFLLLRRETWDRLGGFDPAFVMYGEEADLCLRARADGARPRVTPEATIVHHGGASETVLADKLVRLMRAKMTLIERHFPPRARRPGRLLFALWPLSRWLGLTALAAAFGRARWQALAQAWGEGWSRRAEWVGGFDGG